MAVAFAIVAIVAIVAFLIWRLYATAAANNTRRDADCVASGGTRTQIGHGGPVLCMHLEPPHN